MMYKSESRFLFPKQIIICDNPYYESFRNDLISFCYSERNKDIDGVLKSNVGGWQSNSAYLHELKDFSRFFQELKDQFEYCLFKQFHLLDGVSLAINDLWINISEQENYNMLHKHPLSVYSGVFYIKCEEGCGNIVFQEEECDTVDLHLREEEFKSNHLMYQAYTFKPKEGRMILFPSNLRHRVELNLSKSDRISIAFNCLVP